MTELAINHRRAVRYSQRSTADLWVTALAAARIVGRREPGATAALARDCYRSVDRVEGWARAGVLYRDLRFYFGNHWIHSSFDKMGGCLAVLRDCRRQLSISHWEAVSRERVRQDFIGWTCLVWLYEALQGGWSVEQLREHMSRTEPTHPDFPDRLGQVYDMLRKEADKWGGAEAEVWLAAADVLDQARAALVPTR